MYYIHRYVVTDCINFQIHMYEFEPEELEERSVTNKQTSIDDKNKRPDSYILLTGK